MESVTLPFTAKKDGVLYANINPSSSSQAALYYITENSTGSFLNIVADNGVRATVCAPIVAGNAYANNYSSNVGSVLLKAFYL